MRHSRLSLLVRHRWNVGEGQLHPIRLTLLGGGGEDGEDTTSHQRTVGKSLLLPYLEHEQTAVDGEGAVVPSDFV